jgi:HAD superfamily hydrolase (TIGR01549 family)
MNRKKYQAVLWDWDGVIFDSDREIWRATGVALAHYDAQVEPYEIFRHRKSNHLSRYIDYGVPESAKEELGRIFFEHYDISRCGLMKGVREILLHLQNTSVPCGIVSAHQTEEILLKLSQFGAAHHFQHVIGAAWHKQQALIDVCDKFEVSPENVLFVGDMLSDVLDGKAAGVTTVLYAPVDSPHATKAHHHITSLEQLISLLDT